VILSNSAIFDALDDGRLVLEPEPSPRVSDGTGTPSPFGTSSLDLRLGSVLQVPKQAQLAIDLREKGNIADTLMVLSDSMEIDPEKGYKLKRNQLVLAQTLERISLPLPQNLAGTAVDRPALAARIEGKSSRARFGLLVHFTAPTIHAGWDGPITLEMMCLGPLSFTLYPGLPICQLIVEEVKGEPIESLSQFQGQTTPAGDAPTG